MISKFSKYSKVWVSCWNPSTLKSSILIQLRCYYSDDRCFTHYCLAIIQITSSMWIRILLASIQIYPINTGSGDEQKIKHKQQTFVVFWVKVASMEMYSMKNSQLLNGEWWQWNQLCASKITMYHKCYTQPCTKFGWNLSTRTTTYMSTYQ